MSEYLKLMADYCSDGVWVESGAMTDRDALPISDGLKDDIAGWCATYEDSEFYHEPHERKGVFDTEAFNERGRLLADRLRSELPDWRIEHQPQVSP